MKISLPHLPDDVVQTAREWRANMALLASIFGSMALTVFAGAIVFILWQGGWPVDTAIMRLKILGDALLLVLSGSLVVLITLGFAINRRMVKIGPGGIETTGGGDDDSDNPAPVATVTATATIQTPTPAPSPAAPAEPDPAQPPAQ